MLQQYKLTKSMNSAENMTKYSLRAWVLVLALAPTILVGILLGSYFTINRFYELEESLIERGSNIIEPLAIAAEIGLETKNFETTKRLITSVQLNKSNLVQFIAIFDTKETANKSCNLGIERGFERPA
ncbi:hypothetical protein [Shewanella colwelliana]|uniref:hypothetical protein n=1 Tax=Shewanella colwelliana TaxID=23 RepID=UPI00048D74BD